MEIKWDRLSAAYRTQESLDSVRREALCIALTEVVMSMNLLRLTKICFRKIHSIDRISKHLSVTFPSKNASKKVVHFFPTLLLSMPMGSFRQTKKCNIRRYTSESGLP
jgi:hypothetical protein